VKPSARRHHVRTFGYGLFGCLGLNDEQNRLVPTLLAAEVFEGSKIVTVADGDYTYTMAVGSEREALGVGLWMLQPSGPGRHQQKASANAGGGGGGVWGVQGAHGCLRT
jgi:hypothetical protein